jgi:hypothetical protein
MTEMAKRSETRRPLLPGGYISCGKQSRWVSTSHMQNTMKPSTTTTGTK